MSNAEHQAERRPYDSPIRREQAELTRRRIVEAAREIFARRGYARASVRQIAQQAAVSEQTIYATFGNKRGIVRGIVEDLDLRAGAQQHLADSQAASGDPARQLAIHVGYDRRLFERGGTTLMLLKDAASSDPELAKGYRAGREFGHSIHVALFQEWERSGALSVDLSPVEAADLYHAHSSIDTYNYLVADRGWTPDTWQAHTEALLALALLQNRDEDSDTGARG